jgi:hypothetical protein
MSNVGLLESITSKDINTKYGLKKKYSVKIDGVWYDAGWKKPTAVEGTHVSFTSKDTSYGKEIDGGLTPAVAGLGAGTSTSAKPAAPAARGKFEAAPFPVPPLDPSRSIIRQNALRHATATVSMYMEHQRHIPPVNPIGGGVTSLCDSVILAAKKYEEYISGYDTMTEVEKSVEE